MLDTQEVSGSSPLPPTIANRRKNRRDDWSHLDGSFFLIAGQAAFRPLDLDSIVAINHKNLRRRAYVPGDRYMMKS